MAKTSAQRQAEYRERNLRNWGVSGKLAAVVSVDAISALQRMSRYLDLSQAATLEGLIIEAESLLVLEIGTTEYFAESLVKKIENCQSLLTKHEQRPDQA